MTAKERRDAWLALFQAAIEASCQKWYSAYTYKAEYTLTSEVEYPTGEKEKNYPDGHTKEATAEWSFRGHQLTAFFLDTNDAPEDELLAAWGLNIRTDMRSLDFEDHVETWKWLHEAAE